jgi:hypothetical protein
MHVLFFNSSTMFAFQATNELILDIFDFGHKHHPADLGVDEYLELFAEFGENIQIIDGDRDALPAVFIALLRGGHHSVEYDKMREELVVAVGLVYGFTGTNSAGSGSLTFKVTDDQADFDEELRLHQIVASPVGRA